MSRSGVDMTGIDAGLVERGLEYIFLGGGRERKRHDSWRYTNFFFPLRGVLKKSNVRMVAFEA